MQSLSGEGKEDKMSDVNTYFQLAMNVMDIYMMICYLNAAGKGRRTGNVIFGLCSILYLAGLTWVNINVSTAWGNFFVSVVGTVALSLFYYGSLMERLIWDFVFIGFELMAELCSGIILIFKEGRFDNRDVSAYIEGNIFAKILLLFFVAVMIRYRKEKHTRLPMRTGIVIFLTTLLSMISSMCFIDTVKYYGKDDVYQCMMGAVGLLFINFLIVIFFEQFHSMYQKMMENQQIQYEMEKKESYYRQLEEAQKEIRTIRHDLKNQLLELNVRLEEEGQHHGESRREMAGRLVGHLLGELEKDKRYSTNFSVNVILMEKMKTAKEKNIPVDYRINIGEEVELEPGDMGVILGNLLDNAIEAGEKVANPYIKLAVTQRNNSITIMIENRTLEETKGGIGKTTKKDKKNHGMGLQSVERLVKKYGGELKLERETGIFRVKIIFYVP